VRGAVRREGGARSAEGSGAPSSGIVRDSAMSRRACASSSAACSLRKASSAETCDWPAATEASSAAAAARAAADPLLAALWYAVKPEGAGALFVRRGALHFLMPFAAYHLQSLPRAGAAALQAVAEGRLLDSQVEVQEVAATALQAALMPQAQPAQAAAAERFRAQLGAARLPKRVAAPLAGAGAAEAAEFKAYKAKLALATRKRLGACLALGAAVKAHPFDVPSHVPGALAALARCATEPAPVGAAAQKIVAEFRLTHQDTWAQHKAAFTEEQLADIGAVGSGASYFA